jgi:hypothetical protein
VSQEGRVAALTEERDFFLRSLSDLETERRAGDIDDVDYRALKDDYTARAAATIRRLDELDGDAGNGSSPAAGGEASTVDMDDSTVEADGSAPASEASPAGKAPGVRSRRGRRRRPWTWWQKAIAALIVVLLGATAGWLVSHRSGSSSSSSASSRLTGAQVTILLQQAAAVAGHDPVTALGDYRRILAAYPEQPQALTEEGWLLAQGGELGAGDADLRLAEQVDPSWDLPHGYYGIVLFGEKDYAGAVSELDYYLAHGPDPALAGQAQAALAAAQKDVAATNKG